jgi:membrane-bound serine protease (ClpP class)
MVGEVSVDLPRGKVYVDGEIWDAVSGEPIKKGDKVRVVAVDGMVLKVEKIT